MSDVRVVELDAKGWSTADDFYEAFFSAVGAPAWHGKNFDALHDSIVTGDINEVEVPYRIVVKNSQKMKGAAVAVVLDAQKLIQRFADEEGCPVSFELVK